jgi:hypothetical protein
MVKTELYSSLDATTIEIFMDAIEEKRVACSFVEKKEEEGQKTTQRIEIKVTTSDEEKEAEVFAFDLREEVWTDADSVRVRCGKKKIEVKLKKKKKMEKEKKDEAGGHGSIVDKSSSRVAEKTTDGSASARAQNGANDAAFKPVDKWSRLEFLEEMEEELETLDGGEDGLNKMFQDLYKDADDDQRRAMMKSFVESNGTVLSTDWTDVGKKFVEPQAP